MTESSYLEFQRGLETWTTSWISIDGCRSRLWEWKRKFPGGFKGLWDSKDDRPWESSQRWKRLVRMKWSRLFLRNLLCRSNVGKERRFLGEIDSAWQWKFLETNRCRNFHKDFFLGSDRNFSNENDGSTAVQPYIFYRYRCWSTVKILMQLSLTLQMNRQRSIIEGWQRLHVSQESSFGSTPKIEISHQRSILIVGELSILTFKWPMGIHSKYSFIHSKGHFQDSSL